MQLLIIINRLHTTYDNQYQSDRFIVVLSQFDMTRYKLLTSDTLWVILER